MPFPNIQAQTGIYNMDATSILQGCGVLLQSGTTFNATNVSHTTGSDVWCFGVTCDNDIASHDIGNVYQAGYSNVQLRMAASCSSGDKLIVADNIGQFKPALSSSQIVQYIAIENGTAGNLCWAAPYDTSVATPAPLIQTASGSVSTNLTTTSTSLVDMTGASVTITTVAGSKVLINASYSTSTASVLGATTTIVLDIDGSTEVGSASSFTLLANSTQGGAFNRLKTGLSAGSHTFKLRWLTSASTAQCRPISNPTTEHASITVTEVRV